MVQKEPRRPRGRPREYDPQLALGRAMDAFWDAGFSGTSLDDLGARMRMNRPSLYAAFGNKEALYVQALERYLAERRALITSAFSPDQALPEALRQMYYRMIERLLEGDRGARGCFLLGTAVTETVVNKEVRKMVVASEREMDGFLQGVFTNAQTRGEVGPGADPKALAVLAWSVTHTLALRARAGQPREDLRELANAAVDVIFAAGGRGKSRLAARAPSSRQR